MAPFQRRGQCPPCLTFLVFAVAASGLLPSTPESSVLHLEQVCKKKQEPICIIYPRRKVGQSMRKAHPVLVTEAMLEKVGI